MLIARDSCALTAPAPLGRENEYFGDLIQMLILYLIINFGGQHTHLISREVRELNAYTEIVHHYSPNRDAIDSIKPRVIRLLEVLVVYYDENASRIYRFLISGIPVLGVCYVKLWVSAYSFYDWWKS